MKGGMLESQRSKKEVGKIGGISYLFLGLLKRIRAGIRICLGEGFRNFSAGTCLGCKPHCKKGSESAIRCEFVTDPRAWAANRICMAIKWGCGKRLNTVIY
jgi:hypothetical protein